MKSLPHLFDYTLKNRAFNCRMRNRYYEEVYYAFRSLEQRLKNYENQDTDNQERFYTIDQEIRRYEQILEKCLEYAQASVFFGKTNKMTLFSKDRRYGILQEEFFLVYFLQELLATTRYIISRIETDTLLREMENKAKSGQTETEHVSGFWRNLQKNLEILNHTTIKEFQDLCKHIQERFQTGNSVFGTLQELQHFY